MANEQIFSSRAENYSKGRFGYAPGVVDLVCSKILKPNDRIADIGSGTGIFAEEFIRLGYDVYCVEPNKAMRMQAEKIFGDNPHYISIAASAEETTLPEHGIDLVTAASAFHWFDPEKFYAECRRILKKNGILFTVSNVRDYSDPFTQEQHRICEKFCKDFTSFRHGIDKSIPQYKKIFGSNLNHAEFDFPLEYTKEKFIQRSLSSSFAPESGTKEYELYVRSLRELMDQFAPSGNRITVPNTSVVYWGKLS